MNINNLFEYICQATYNYNDNCRFHIITDQAQKDALWGAINKWVSTEMTLVEMNKRLAELEAKCHAYEQIIANSNFSPIIPQPKMGRWVNDKCSVCGKGTEDFISSREWYRNEEPNFCPNCGVKLVDREVDNEQSK